MTSQSAAFGFRILSPVDSASRALVFRKMLARHDWKRSMSVREGAARACRFPTLWVRHLSPQMPCPLRPSNGGLAASSMRLRASEWILSDSRPLCRSRRQTLTTAPHGSLPGLRTSGPSPASDKSFRVDGMKLASSPS